MSARRGRRSRGSSGRNERPGGLWVNEPEKALDQLERCSHYPISCILSPAWLRIDPTFAPLSG